MATFVVCSCINFTKRLDQDPGIQHKPQPIVRPDRGPPDLGPNRLQMLSADDTTLSMIITTENQVTLEDKTWQILVKTL